MKETAAALKEAFGTDLKQPSRCGRPGVMRVAYVVHTFDMGGLERCVAHLVNYLDRSRFQPLLVCLNRAGDACRWINSSDVPVLELHKPPGNDLRTVYRLATVLRQSRVHLAHSQNWCTLVETALARRWAGVPLHLHCQQGFDRGFLNLQGWAGRVRAEVMRWAMHQADAVVVVADELVHFLAHKCYFPKHRIRVIGNGVELPPLERLGEQREAIRRQLNLRTGAVLVGSVGRLVEVKGYEILIDAFARLVRTSREVHLVLVGDGPERQRLAEHARGANVAERVHLVGLQSNVPSWLGAMDIFVNSSHSEGMSLAVLEGMAAGLPLVVTDVGANALLANGEPPCGLVVPPRDPIAFAGALGKIIADPLWRSELGSRARRHAGAYSVQETTRVYERLYSSLQKD